MPADGEEGDPDEEADGMAMTEDERMVEGGDEETPGGPPPLEHPLAAGFR